MVCVCLSVQMVCKWDVQGRTAVRTFQAADSAVSAMCSGTDDDLPLFTAGTSVRGWEHVDDDNEETAEAAVTFTGHAGGTGYLCANRVASHVVTAAIGQPDDNLVYAWPRKSSSKRRAAQPQAFAAPGAVTAVDVASDGAGPDGQWAVAVVCEGTVHVFVPPKRTSKKPLAAAGTLAFSRTKKKKKSKAAQPGSGESIDVLSACFSRRRPATHIVTARGNLTAPVFEEVEYADSDGTVTAVVDLAREATASHLLRGSAESGVVAAQSAVAPMDVTMIAAGAKVGASASGGSSAPGEVPFGEQVLQLGLSVGSGPGALKAGGVAEGATPTARSLAHMLAQALHSNDQSLLEECLSNTNESIVRNTVRIHSTLQCSAVRPGMS